MKKIYVLTLLLVTFLGSRAICCTGSRPIAMGGAFIAVSDSADATYWNPAGLAFIGKESESHTGESQLSRYPKNETFSLPISKKKAIGYFETENRRGERLSMNYMIDWYKFNGDTGYYQGTEFRSSKVSEIAEVWQGVSYSQRISKRSAVGVNFKVSTPNISPADPLILGYNRQVRTFGYPEVSGMRLIFPRGEYVGLVRRMSLSLPEDRNEIDLAYKFNLNRNLSFGMLLQNVSSWHTSDGEATDQNTNARLGIAYHEKRVTLAFDYYGALSYLLFGAEYRVNNRLTLRGGRYDRTPTSGLGWKVNKDTTVNITQYGESIGMGISKEF